MKIATLGPKGTFSHEAVLNYNKKAGMLFKDTLSGIFEAVYKGKAQLGIVPIENSTAGTVGLTLDALTEFNLFIVGELILPIDHHLAGSGKKEEIKTVYVHPQTYEQCEKYFRRDLRGIEIIQTSSNGKSAEIVAEKKSKKIACVVPKISAETYKLKLIRKHVQDNDLNETRFIVISKKEIIPKTDGKTSILIMPKEDRPGLLYDMLGVFAKRKINLTKIESRPSKDKIGTYYFFMDLLGAGADRNIQVALNELEKFGYIKVLGSYPKAKR